MVVIFVLINSQDIDGINLYNISGEVKVVSHDGIDIKIDCEQINKISVEEKDGHLCIGVKREQENTIKKSFFHKIFKPSFKLNLHHSTSYIEDNDNICVNTPLLANMTIYVPFGLVEQIHLEGNLKLIGGGFTSFLKVYASGNNVVDISDVKNIYIDNNGIIECFIKGCLTSSMYSIGKSFVRLSAKNIYSLKLKSKGEFESDIIGNIDDLNIDSSGISHIYIVGKVKHKKIKRKGILKLTITS
jgi:hypothetical protein